MTRVLLPGRILRHVADVEDPTMGTIPLFDLP